MDRTEREPGEVGEDSEEDGLWGRRLWICSKPRFRVGFCGQDRVFAGIGKEAGEGRGQQMEHLRTPDEYLSHSPVRGTLMEGGISW